MKKAKDYAWKVLPELLNTEGMSGNCGKIVALMEKKLKELNIKAEKTNKGGLIVKLKGKDNSKVRLMTAHVDTLGAMVKKTGGDGRVFIVPVGGVYPYSIEGEYVTIETAAGKRYRGTVVHNNPSAHVNATLSKEERNFDNISIRLDEKVKSSDDVKKLGISVGDYCYFDPRVEVTKSGFIKSRHLDDKAGVAALLGTIDYFTRNKEMPEYETWFYISVAEEVGNGTVSKLPQNCFEIVAVDMGALGNGQTSDEYTVSICAKDSSGPFDYELRKKIVGIAEKNKIPYKVDIYPMYGSDAAAALRTGIDAKHALFGPGVDASHSYERVHRDSLDATAELTIKYILEK
jgi:putative aminopeptidase FrvX